MLGRRRPAAPQRITQPLPLKWTPKEHLAEMVKNPARYVRHLRAPPNTPLTIIPMARNKRGRLVERRSQKYTNEPPKKEFVPLRDLPGALLRHGKLRREVVPNAKEVELQYSNKLGWHPVKQVSRPVRSKSNTRSNRPRTEFVPLRHLPSALFKHGKLRREVVPNAKEVELRYSNKLGWHPVKQPNAPRSRSSGLLKSLKSFRPTRRWSW